MDGSDVVTRVQLGKVLLATDFSNGAHAALPYALSIANKYGSQLLVAHVMSPAAAESGASRNAMLGETAHRSGVRAVRDFLARLEGFPHEVLIRRGDVWTELSEIITANHIDLVAMGTRGESDYGQADLGSTARQALRHAPCPVLTIGSHVSPGGAHWPQIREVLYPVDLEPEPLAAATYALSLASEYRARLSLLHGMEDENSPADLLLTQHFYGSIPCGSGLSHRPTSFVKHGPPVERILEAEHERGADLIVLGVKRTDRFSEEPEYLAWSGVERIVTQARCPVLTICS